MLALSLAKFCGLWLNGAVRMQFLYVRQFGSLPGRDRYIGAAARPASLPPYSISARRPEAARPAPQTHEVYPGHHRDTVTAKRLRPSQGDKLLHRFTMMITSNIPALLDPLQQFCALLASDSAAVRTATHHQVFGAPVPPRNCRQIAPWGDPTFCVRIHGSLVSRDPFPIHRAPLHWGYTFGAELPITQ